MIKEFSDIDKLSSGDFEIFVRDVFVAAGWTDAVITQVGKEFRHGDGGVDIYAYKNNRKYAIEVKQRSNSAVGVDSLNQLIGGSSDANVQNMILVTNSQFTTEVKSRALRKGVELVDRDELENLWIKKQSEIGKNIEPREYQEAIITKCIEQYNAGKTKFLIEMATGLGKTYTAAHIVKRIMQQNPRTRILFIAHQVEILVQSATAFKNVFGVGSHSFSACFGGSDPIDTDFVFASFNTLYSRITDLEKQNYDLVIVDEAHHVRAETYAEVVQHFKPKLLLGLTATPHRADNKCVFEFFGGEEGHIGKYDLAWGLKHKHLAFPKYTVLLDDIDQSRIDQLANGLTVSDLDKKLFLHKKDQEVINIIEKTVVEKNIENVKGIVFCKSIEHMQYLIQFFGMGVATLVHSKMRDQERRQNIKDFREGGFRYILVCDLFNEGIDIPETNLLVFLRSTGSRTIWLQQLGRGLRKTPNKEYVHVLDFVGSLARLSDVKFLSNAIKNVKLEPENLESSEEDGRDQIIHDSTLEVSYNQKAAEVLTLIENLNYRLNSRARLIDYLRDYYDEIGLVPPIDQLEIVLGDVTCDQISTIFNSYYGFLDASIPDAIDLNFLTSKHTDWANDYIKTTGALPSAKLVSMQHGFKSLLAFTAKEISELGVIPEELPALQIDDIIISEVESSNRDANAENDGFSVSQRAVISKYQDVIKTIEDFRKLSTDELAEIKNSFKSKFHFVDILNKAKLIKELK